MGRPGGTRGVSGHAGVNGGAGSKSCRPGGRNGRFLSTGIARFALLTSPDVFDSIRAWGAEAIIARVYRALSWGPLGGREACRKAVSESPAAEIEAASGCR